MDKRACATIGRARPRYTAAEKLDIVQYAHAHSARAASEQFHVARSSIYLWFTQVDELKKQLSEEHQRHHADSMNRPNSATTRAVTATPFSLPRVLLASGPGGITAPSTPDDVSIMEAGSLNAFSNEARSSIDQGDALSAAAPEQDHTADFALVGYQGGDCGFASVAARRAFTELISTQGPHTLAFELTGYPHTSHVLDALHKHEIEFGFVATDVLLSNTNHATLDQMVACRLKTIGEIVVQEDVDVCALPGTELCDVDCVVSDWSTLQRCEEFIVRLEKQYDKTIYRQVEWDSSAACRLVQTEQAENTLVLCTTSAAMNHGLIVLQGRLPGSPTHTRYSVIGRCGTAPLVFGGPERALSAPPTIARCTILVKGTASAILDIISAFAFRGLEIVSFHTRGSEQHKLYDPLLSLYHMDELTNVVLFETIDNPS